MEFSNILTTTSLRVKLGLIRRCGLESPDIRRLSVEFLLSALLTPVEVIEDLVFEKRIQSNTINTGPVFLVGHWRSGTTHLHNLLSQDPQFGFSSLFHTVFPKTFFTFEVLRLKPLFSLFLPPTRPQDNVKLSFDLPQECEIGLAVMSPYSFVHGFCFPKQIDDFFRRYILFQELTTEELDNWKKDYLWFIQKVSLGCHNRILVLKNPYHTARIQILSDLFPDARFVHIYRNPYEVFHSTVNAIQKWQADMLLQKKPSTEEVENWVLRWYPLMMEAYHQQRQAIAAHRLVELSFESLVKDPLQELEKIYLHLNLPGFSKAQPQFVSYLENEKNYRQNTYQYAPETLQKVEAAWYPWIRQWNYAPPSS
jgi:hypothetical protein